jgi:hypothetical protein
MNIVATYKSENPQKMALLCSACLAVDKGVPTETIKTDEGWLVVADDGKAILWVADPKGVTNVRQNDA